MTAMNFELVIHALLEILEGQQIRYGVVGGFALGLLGVPRATMDVDLLVHRDDLARLDEALRRVGFQRVVSTENVSHYEHSDAVWGSIDVLHAFRPHALGMLTRTRGVALFDRTIRVLQPEDIIGLKVQAMANNPLRAAKEQVDIESLVEAYSATLDWTRIKEYFDLFEMSELLERLRKRQGEA